jgi:predicted transcriptional regulator
MLKPDLVSKKVFEVLQKEKTFLRELYKLEKKEAIAKAIKDFGYGLDLFQISDYFEKDRHAIRPAIKELVDEGKIVIHQVGRTRVYYAEQQKPSITTATGKEFKSLLPEERKEQVRLALATFAFGATLTKLAKAAKTSPRTIETTIDDLTFTNDIVVILRKPDYRGKRLYQHIQAVKDKGRFL